MNGVQWLEVFPPLGTFLFRGLCVPQATCLNRAFLPGLYMGDTKHAQHCATPGSQQGTTGWSSWA